MLALAGGVWAANGGVGRIKSALADTRTGTCSDPGCFSEEWKATELTGDAFGFDGTLGGNVLTAFERIRETTNYDQLVGGATTFHSYDTWYIKGFCQELIDWDTANSRVTSTATNNGDYACDIDYKTGKSGNQTGHMVADETAIVTGWRVDGHVH